MTFANVPPTFIYPPPEPEQALTADELAHLLATTPGIKIEIDYGRYRCASWLDPSDAWMADQAGPQREVALAEERERKARCGRAGVDA